ncbi:hypothetical protein GGX14DRAFT_574449 [Mycena pura]|uniref:Uncharacterized protein n=1 Tax=Mycena pura TaxID=153505 RepID=A0AAD6UX26_9AGAR|nr:hypothetical protein GGX14DRAFT_574449 [Mycena pura]
MYFTSFNDIIRSCVGLPHLRRLALLSAEWDEDTSAPDLPMLDTFAIDSGQSPEVALRWLPSQPRIRRIAIARLVPQDILLFDNVLRTLGPRLEHLVFDAIFNHNGIVPDLSNATALRTLEIRGRCWNFDGSFLTALLEQLTSHVCALQRIIFILVGLESGRNPRFLDWSRRAPTLASLDSLEQVDFYVSHGSEQWASDIIHEGLVSRKYALRVQESTVDQQECALGASVRGGPPRAGEGAAHQLERAPESRWTNHTEEVLGLKIPDFHTTEQSLEL